jgi:hypothetical protein
METECVPELTTLLEISSDALPVIWDADFFINPTDGISPRYTLCEINVSCVSPFPPSAIPYKVDKVMRW